MSCSTNYQTAARCLTSATGVPATAGMSATANCTVGGQPLGSAAAVTAGPPVMPAFKSGADLAAWLNQHGRELVDEQGESTVADYATLDRPWSDDTGTDYRMALACDEPQDPATIKSLLGYVFRGPMAMGGEYSDAQCVAVPVAGSGGRLFIADVDLTKSQRDDLGQAFETDALPMLRAGTPIRKTDRAGAGTKGTRAWSGITGGFQIAW